MTNLANAWTAAAKAEQDAREAAEQFHRENVKPIYAAHDAGSATLDESIAQEEAYGQFTAAHHDAMKSLMEAPAPAWPDVIQKLRFGVDDWYFDGSRLSLEAIQVIRAEVERLAAVGNNSTPWDAAMQARAQASEEFAAQEALTPGGDALDELCNTVTDAEDALFRTDAPNLQAALWKLDHLQEEAAASSITPAQIRQVSNDIRRLIGEA